MPSPEQHDYHHAKFDSLFAYFFDGLSLRFTQNFGHLGLLDYLHGTNAKFLNSVEYKRNFVLWDRRSAHELCPADKQ